MKIRKTREKDFKGMIKLFIEEYAKPPYKDKWTKKEAIKSIKSEVKKGISYIAKDDKKIVVFITVTKETPGKIYLFIENLVVDSNYQRKGIGKRLVEQIEKKYKKKNTIISLSVNKNSPAYKFYKRLGYRENKVNVNMGKKLK